MTTEAVNQFMTELAHPLKAEIEAVRAIILSADAAITEHIKWNAPSFCYAGEDCITFKLHPPKHIQLIFHRGAKVKDSSDFTFEDASGLLQWVTKDRAMVTLQNQEQIDTNREVLQTLVKNWMKATS